MVEMHPVASSNIDAVGHDASKSEMHVRFKNGGTHVFSGVDHTAFTLMRNAESVGKHFHAHIRGKHDSRKLEAPTDAAS